MPWKLWLAADNGTVSVYRGETHREWELAPWTGVQLLLVGLEAEQSGKSRVGWYRDRPGLWGEYAHYRWGPDDHPEGVTPDAVLDMWRQRTGRTDVTLADLSLDDYRAIGVKLGRSLPTPQFERILQDAIADPEIQ